MQVSLLHTNDLHGHLEQWSSISEFILNKQHEYQKNNITYFTLDIGDAMDTVHPMVEATSGQIMVDVMNEIPYDFVTLGNNEGLNFTPSQLQSRYASAKFEVIISNLIDSATQLTPSWTHRYVTRQVGNKTFAFIGLTAPYQTYKLNNYQIIQPKEALRSAIDEINRSNDIDCYILLSHLGLQRDREIAEEFPELSVILGAHTHHVLHDGEFINQTMLAAAGRYGDYVGEVSINIDDETGEITTQAQVHNMHTSTVRIEDNQNGINYYKIGQEQLCKDIIVTLPHPYLALEKEGELSFVQMALDAISWSSGVDLAMLNTGLFLIDLPEGELTRKDLHEALPHPMHLAKMTFTGEQLEELLNEIYQQVDDLQYKLVNGLGFRGKIFGEVVFKGIFYDSQMHQWLVHGMAINNDQIYQIVTVDHLWFVPFFSSIDRYTSPQLIFPDFIRHIVEKYLKKIYQ